jgi:uncharacterized protein (TIGR03067 family)
MRIALVTLLCTLVLTTPGGTGARADDKAGVEKELKKFQGTWTFESVAAGGKEVPAAEFKGMTVTFEGDKYTVMKGDEVIQVGTQKLDPSRSPKALDVTVAEGPEQGGGHAGHLRDQRGHAEGLLRPRGEEAADGAQERVRLADFRRPQAREEVNQSGKQKEAGVESGPK